VIWRKEVARCWLLVAGCWLLVVRVCRLHIHSPHPNSTLTIESTLKSRIIYIPKNNQNLILANSFSPFQKGEIE
jgi:hypothetical protein